MGTSGCLLKEGGLGQHSRNTSSPCWYGGLRNTSSSHMDELGSTPRVSKDRSPTAAELIEEISALECEIVRLEKHLLSLYRKAFSRCLADSPSTTPKTKLSSSSCRESQLEDDQRLFKCSKMSADLRTFSADRTSHESKKNQRPGDGHCRKYASNDYNSNNDYHAHIRAISDISYLLGQNLKKDIEVTPCNGILADHLCASLREVFLETPCKLSEDIVRCISAAYYKLNDSRVSQTVLSSPFSSLSSSSTFSLQDRSDNWSPQFNYEISRSPIKERYDSFPVMVEISRISIDKDRFKCAAALLERYRNLIKRLEAVDPSKFGHEEKLAFWINIHNAMVMHALIAYGLENSSLRITPMILKKSYNVGGRNVNAYEIQSSIFGCNPRYKVISRSIFSPSMKLTTINNKHPYALKHPEPLVHFALSMGAYSDPPVRAYNAKNVIKQLEIAKEEFIQANVIVQKGNKVMLPKILEFYAKDASLDLSSLLKAVHDCLPRDRQQSLQECLKGKLDRHTQWSPYRSTFRYILHGDLDINK